MEILLLPIAGVALVGVAAISGWVAFRMGKTLVLDILANTEPLPGWLEAAAPLKGRWLRLFLAAPGVALLLVFIFGIVFYMLVLALLAIIMLFALVGAAVIGALGG